MNVGVSNYGGAWLRWVLWEAENGTCSDSSYHSITTKVPARRTARSGRWHTTAAGTAASATRDQNFDTTNDAPVAGTLYPAEQYSSCPIELMGLSNYRNALSTIIEAMQAQGNTNQAIGSQMGWQSLMAAPFTVPPRDPN